ncbi:MAG TPA: FAD-binding oxidoreductase [Acidimicrobiales bacterium]|nr:FAD-binding oxidoreductase [Acidimicrobiales bacterium]
MTGPRALGTALGSIVGAGNVLSGLQATAAFSSDATGTWRGSARCVVLPATADELAAVITELVSRDVAYVVQGGNTGLVAGATPLGGEVVVSTRRLSGVDSLDAPRREMRVRAGTSLAQVQRVAAAAGLELAVDLAARDAATIGGLVATDAAGSRSLRHGRMGAQLLEVDVVLPEGVLVRGLEVPPRAATRATGAGRGRHEHLARLVAGSEGTLGTVTSARVRLVPRLGARATALVAVARVADAVELAARARRALPSLDAMELVESDAVELVAEAAASHPPLAGTALVLLECAAAVSPRRELASFLEGADEVRGVLVATDATARAQLWSWRRDVPAALASVGGHALDVGVPLARVPELLARVRAALAALAPGSRLVAFGRLGVGALHLHVVGAAAGHTAVDAAIARAVVELGGDVAGEHGVGRAKAALLERGGGEAPREPAGELKAVLDPRNLANPGVPAMRGGAGQRRW